MMALEELLLAQHPPSTNKLSELLEGHRKMVDTEEKRKDRAKLMVSVAMFLGFVEAMSIAVNKHVTNDEERAAVGEEFDTLIRRANYAELSDTALGKVH